MKREIANQAKTTEDHLEGAKKPTLGSFTYHGSTFFLTERWWNMYKENFQQFQPHIVRLKEYIKKKQIQ